MPRNIKPMLATLTNESFNDDDWFFEIKLDGYRAVAEIENNNVELYSRNLNSFNKLFSPIVESLKMINHQLILDGEVVVVDEEGKSNFQLLQNYQKTGKGKLAYFVFDMLYADGHDLRILPLLQRKKLLKKILPEIPNVIYSDHIIGEGVEFFKIAGQKELEGIVAKYKESRYQTGKRSKEWLKIKTKLRQEAVIGGFTKPKGSRKNFGALVLGVYEGKNLRYIGHTGGGFKDIELKDLYDKLKPLERKTSPFKEEPKTNTPVTWVKPELICEVTFSEWTGEGIMRHPIYLGLRKDKDPKQVVEEKADEEMQPKKGNKKPKKKSDKEVSIQKHNLKLTNLDKVYWPDEGYTKGDLIEYYKSVSKLILPYLKNRPESLLRHPNGINSKGFFQKDMDSLPPDWVDTKKIYSESNDKDINYFLCNDEASLIYLANLGCIEINPWFSRVGSLTNPDYTVIDLDPEDISFDKVVETALAVKKVLDKAGAKSFIKTSGATGMHIYIPLGAKYDFDVAKDFAHLIGTIVNNEIPDFTSLERSPSKRQKKVYLDYLQNRKGQTLAAPYSVRPRPKAPVSTPLKWEEVKVGLDPTQFTIKTIHKRLDKTGDLFEGILGEGINIEECIKNLGGK